MLRSLDILTKSRFLCLVTPDSIHTLVYQKKAWYLGNLLLPELNTTARLYSGTLQYHPGRNGTVRLLQTSLYGDGQNEELFGMLQGTEVLRSPKDHYQGLINQVL